MLPLDSVMLPVRAVIRYDPLPSEAAVRMPLALVYTTLVPVSVGPLVVDVMRQKENCTVGALAVALVGLHDSGAMPGPTGCTYMLK